LKSPQEKLPGEWDSPTRFLLLLFGQQEESAPMKRLAEKPGDIVQPNLRIREDLRQRLEREARKNQRSLNKEMIRRLERSFEADTVRSLEDIVADLTKALRRVSVVR
jgi:hypothetical protein